jgi:cytochrome c peroxidase
MRIPQLCSMTIHFTRTSGARHFAVAVPCIAILSFVSFSFGGILFPNPLFSPSPSGVLSTFGATGKVDTTNPFFQSIGTNGRSCNTCHIPSSAWSITPADVQTKFNGSNGTEPIFRTNDGSNCPSDDVSTPRTRAAAYSLLLKKALFRISLQMPLNAEFQIIQIQDPYNCPETTAANPAFYRRPLPAANLKFLSAVMWDGRETVFGAIPGKSLNLVQSLKNQAHDATTGHAQGVGPTDDQLAEIVSMETGLFTAQFSDRAAGNLTEDDANGGPHYLSQQNTYIGINDALGGDPEGAPFNPNVFTLYGSWRNSPSPHRRSIARGEELFNSLPIPITGVAGLNDALNLPVIAGTCTTCHDTPNAGNHSMSIPLGIGTTVYPVSSALDISGLPIYTVECIATGETVQVTDIGRAMLSGKCSDVGKIKGPILRGLSARAPYFHNGGAATLENVVEFYNQRFNLGLTLEQKSDLVAFLNAL